MKAYLIDVQNEKACVVETDSTLESYYKLLACNTIDIVTRKINGKYYDIIVDDEGLYSDDVRISAITPEGENMLVGNLLVLNCPDRNDEDGNERGLDDEDVQRISKKVSTSMFRNGRVGITLECEC